MIIEPQYRPKRSAPNRRRRSRALILTLSKDIRGGGKKKRKKPRYFDPNVLGLGAQLANAESFF